LKENIIDIKAEPFPLQARLIGIVLFVLAAGIVSNYWWISILLVLIGVALVFGYSGTQIDASNKTFREYTSYVFFKSGDTEKYKSIERIFINRSKVSQKMYTARTLDSSTFRYVLYNAYMKLDDGNKIFLTSRKDKDQLIKFLSPLVKTLNTQLNDNTL
jgi:hypothetical protein